MAQGVITCPFHGWRFNTSGHCLHVPWNPDAKLGTLSAISLSVREAGSIIWLNTGREPGADPNMPDALLRPDVRVTAQTFLWRVHWTRVMENMLDAPHLPFVHARTIGKRLRGRTSASMEMVWTPTEHGADITTVRPDEPRQTNLHYHFPNAMEMVVDPRTPIKSGHSTCAINCTMIGRPFVRLIGPDKWELSRFTRRFLKTAIRRPMLLRPCRLVLRSKLLRHGIGSADQFPRLPCRMLGAPALRLLPPL